MLQTTSYDSITKKVLNENTGELEKKEFIENKQKKKIKGGFNMVYKSYEETVENIIKSKLDFTILLEIKNKFTYQRVECVISPTDIAKKTNCSKPKVVTLIKLMIDNELLKRVDRGTYRLNPFMYLPFRANAEELQYEWNQIK